MIHNTRQFGFLIVCSRPSSGNLKWVELRSYPQGTDCVCSCRSGRLLQTHPFSLGLTVSCGAGCPCCLRMQISPQLVNVVFVGVFLTWGLMCIIRRRSGWSGEGQRAAGGGVSSVPTVCSLVTVVCNVAISLLYLCFCFYEYWESWRLDGKSVSYAVSWISASVVAVYCRKRNLIGGSNWPLVLILWWVYSTILSTVSVSFFLITKFRSKGFPLPLVGANVVNMISCALSIVLSSTAVSSSCRGKCEINELMQPLLPGGLERDSKDFEGAGVWSQLTFQWLNPLFKTGQVQNLELKHIPLVPWSESADFASSLLEASLWKQKTGPSSLLKAISFAVWKSMAINGVIAGTMLNFLINYIPGIFILLIQLCFVVIDRCWAPAFLL